jgi:lysosomal Pro-X carboxypeptidase
MIDVLAPKFGAFLLFPEERYYGESLPFGNQTFASGEHLKFLSTAQILADYAELVQHVKATTPGMEHCPVVAFGGSYGGTLTTLMRLTYPNVVVGGLASSAPVGYYDPEGWPAHGVDGFTWAGIVARDYDEAHPLCLRTIEAARVAIEAAPVGDLVKAFGVCEPAGLGPNAPSDLFMYVLESLPQLDYPMQIGSLPAWPVNATCAMLTKADATDPNALISAAADVVHMLMGSGVPHATGKGASSCIPTADEGPGGIPGDGPGGISAWSFQSCTETLHQFSSRINQNAYQGIRNFKFDKETWVDPLCARLFNNTVKPDVMRLAREFGGYKISDNSEGVTNLIWSNGGMDPWHGGGFYPGDKPGAAGMEGKTHVQRGSNHYVWIRRGAHHGDLRSASSGDPEELTAARALETDIIAGWIKAAGERIVF